MEVVFGGSQERPDLLIKAGDPADAEKDRRVVDMGDMAAHTDGFTLDGQISFKSGKQILIQGFLGSQTEVSSTVSHQFITVCGALTVGVLIVIGRGDTVASRAR